MTSEPQHPYVDRLYRIVTFWQATHEIKSIHMSRTTHRELAKDITGREDRANTLDEFMGIPIRYCHIDGCDDGPNEACFSVFTGEPLTTVEAYDPNKVWTEEPSTLVVADRDGNVIDQGLALLKLGTLSHSQFRKEYMAEWVSNPELPPEGLIWE